MIRVLYRTGHMEGERPIVSSDVWAIGKTFKIDPECVSELHMDGPEYEHVNKYVAFRDTGENLPATLTGTRAVFVANFLRYTRGINPPEKSAPPEKPKRGKK